VVAGVTKGTFARVVRTAGCTVDELIGDGVLAVFGAPAPRAAGVGFALEPLVEVTLRGRATPLGVFTRASPTGEARGRRRA
jgi:hypothetical protein